MSRISRRSLIQAAMALGASAALGPAHPRGFRPWREQRDCYPEGVASGDPETDNVLLWTRRPPKDGRAVSALYVEVAEDQNFQHVVAAAKAPISETSDWTCRVLAGGLQPSTVYWYRFTDPEGHGSRMGRTITAPSKTTVVPCGFPLSAAKMRIKGPKTHTVA